jgi:hypothetical protein
MANQDLRRQERLLKEAIRGLVTEEKVNRLLESVRITEDDLFNLEEGRWDGIKKKLAAAGLAIACTATGCAPVMQSTGQPVDPAQLDDIGFNMDDLRPGESGVDYDDTGSKSSEHDSDHEDEVPATGLGSSVKINRAGRRGSLR